MSPRMLLRGTCSRHLIPLSVVVSIWRCFFRFCTREMSLFRVSSPCVRFFCLLHVLALGVLLPPVVIVCPATFVAAPPLAWAKPRRGRPRALQISLHMCDLKNRSTPLWPTSEAPYSFPPGVSTVGSVHRWLQPWMSHTMTCCLRCAAERSNDQCENACASRWALRSCARTPAAGKGCGDMWAVRVKICWDTRILRVGRDSEQHRTRLPGRASGHACASIPMVMAKQRTCVTHFRTSLCQADILGLAHTRCFELFGQQTDVPIVAVVLHPVGCRGDNITTMAQPREK